MFLCITWGCGKENEAVSFVQPQCDADVDHQHGCQSKENTRANDAEVTKGSGGRWLTLYETKLVRDEVCSPENSKPGTYVSPPVLEGITV